LEKLRIIVGGYIGTYCTSGVTWDYIQYPVGLNLLGHDVFYLEDTLGKYCHYFEGYEWDDVSPIVNYIRTTMNYFGLNNRWAYRDEMTGNTYGMSQEKLKEICSTADVFINVSHSTFMRDEYINIPKRVLIDSDPMFTQIQDLEKYDNSDEKIKEMFSRFNYLFSFGENINGADSKVPLFDREWKTTRQPVCMKYWINNNPKQGKNFSTVMNMSARKKILYKNEHWGQKDIEFKKFLDLPKKFKKAGFDIVLNCSSDNKDIINKKDILSSGWNILEPGITIKDINNYKDFIHNSFGEFSVAKETYVKSNSGWFSGRSACYLASGKPVIVQDTGWSDYIRNGNGLFGFKTEDDALSALEQVTSDPEKHSDAALQIADEYFNSDKVLTKLLEDLI
jgi:glycosyltransferase involved in cell wall biosynthesis